MIITNRKSYGRGNTFKVCSQCGKIGHTIDTCYKKHAFPPQFKFKNKDAYSINNELNNEGSKSEI